MKAKKIGVLLIALSLCVCMFSGIALPQVTALDSSNIAILGRAFDEGKELVNNSSLVEINDGDYLTSWQLDEVGAEGEGSEWPDGTYVGIAFNTPKIIDEVAIYVEEITRYEASADGVVLEYSVDGTDFAPVPNAVWSYNEKFDEGYLVKDAVTFEAIEIKAIRLMIYKSVNKYAPKITEIKIFEAEGESTPEKPNHPLTDADFKLSLTASDADCCDIGDEYEVYITPTDIKTDAGICSYDIAEIHYDASAFSFSATDVSIDNPNFLVSASRVTDGIIRLIVTDNTEKGAALYDGEGKVTLTFTVRYTCVSEISLAGKMGGTDNQTLERLIATTDGAITVDTTQSCSFDYGEDIEPTCTEGGYYQFICTKCGDVMLEPKGEQALGHDFSVLIDSLEPTDYDDGFNEYKCSRCNETYTEIVDSLIPVYTRGDVNEDGVINSTDFMQVRKYFLEMFVFTSRDKLLAADTNEDGKINSTDFMQIRRHFLGLFDLYA